MRPSHNARSINKWWRIASTPAKQPRQLESRGTSFQSISVKSALPHGTQGDYWVQELPMKSTTKKRACLFRLIKSFGTGKPRQPSTLESLGERFEGKGTALLLHRELRERKRFLVSASLLESILEPPTLFEHIPGRAMLWGWYTYYIKVCTWPKTHHSMIGSIS